MTKLPQHTYKCKVLVDLEFQHLIDEINFIDNGNGYMKCSINGKKVYLHRLIMGDRAGYFIDHINQNKLDNRKSNLRYVTPRQNSFNRPMNRNNTSGVTGVKVVKGKYIAHISPHGKSIHLGSFINLNDASKARKEAEVVYGFNINSYV